MIMLPALTLGALTAAPGTAFAGAKTGSLDFATEDSVAQAANGDTVQRSGEGIFGLQPKDIGGQGSFTHHNADGTVHATGTWTPTVVLSYQSFGPATAEQQAAFGGQLPPGSAGGKLKMQVALFVGSTHVADGIVTIVCLLGTPPPNAVESTLLLVQDTGLNFNAPLSGDNIFIRH